MVYIHFLKLFSFYSHHLNRILGIVALPGHLHFQLCQLWDAEIQLIPEDLHGLRLRPGLVPVKSQPPLVIPPLPSGAGRGSAGIRELRGKCDVKSLRAKATGMSNNEVSD